MKTKADEIDLPPEFGELPFRNLRPWPVSPNDTLPDDIGVGAFCRACWKLLAYGEFTYRAQYDYAVKSYGQPKRLKVCKACINNKRAATIKAKRERRVNVIPVEIVPVEEKEHD